jgi:hypothetical protein
MRGAWGLHLHVPFAAAVTGDRGHRALRRRMRSMCMFHMFDLDVAFVSSGCFICCNGHTHILQLYLPNVSPISSGCCMFSYGCCMLQLLYPYVASVCFKCFSCFRSMLQVFYLDVADVAVTIPICCTSMFQMFLDVYCSKCSLFQVFSLVSTGSERRQRRSPRACASACILATGIRTRAQQHA